MHTADAARCGAAARCSCTKCGMVGTVVQLHVAARMPLCIPCAATRWRRRGCCAHSWHGIPLPARAHSQPCMQPPIANPRCTGFLCTQRASCMHELMMSSHVHAGSLVMMSAHHIHVQLLTAYRSYADHHRTQLGGGPTVKEVYEKPVFNVKELPGGPPPSPSPSPSPALSLSPSPYP